MEAKGLRPSIISLNDTRSIETEIDSQPTDRTYKWNQAVLAAATYGAVLTIVVTAVVFGASHLVFGWGAEVIFGATVDTDLQLALIGFINKVLDFLVQAALERATLVILTTRMISNGTRAASQLDSELFKELTNPYVSVLNFLSRYKRDGDSRWRDFGKFLLCLIVSVSVILSAVGINTIGVPKRRWLPDAKLYPDSPHLLVRGALKVIRGVDSTHVWNQSSAIVGAGPQSWAYMDALVAIESVPSLSYLQYLYLATDRGWQPMDEQTLPLSTKGDIRVTGVNTARADVVRTLSLRYQDIQDVYDNRHMLSNTPPWMSKTSGMTGFFNMTMPMLSTSCKSTAQPVGASSMTVGTANTLSDISFQVSLGPASSLDFTGASCMTSFNQVLFNTTGWNVESTTSDGTFNDYSNNHSHTPILLPKMQADVPIILALTTQLNRTIPCLDGVLPNNSLAELLVAASRNTYGLSRDSFPNEMAALSMPVGLLLQNHLTMATWNMSAANLEDNLDSLEVTHSRMQWLVYGAGPRLKWEWLAVVPLVVLSLVAAAGCMQVFLHRIKPVSWFDMFASARSTEPLFENSADGINGSRLVEVSRNSIESIGLRYSS